MQFFSSLTLVDIVGNTQNDREFELPFLRGSGC